MNKSKLDVSQIFLVYMSLIGDVDKTAAALDLDPKIVGKLAAEEGWETKIRRISILSKSEKPGDWERAQNRALNYVQAHRLRTLIDRILLELFKLDSSALLSEMKVRGLNGSYHLSIKFFADLSTAIEKCHSMTYMAIGDTVNERKENLDPDGVQCSTKQLHAALIAALNNPVIPLEAQRQVIVEGTENTTKQLIRPDSEALAREQIMENTAKQLAQYSPEVPARERVEVND